MTNSLLHGYYGMRNAGDDAFFVISSRELRRTFGSHYVFTNARALTLPRTGTRVVPITIPRSERLSRLAERGAAKLSSHLAFGGGSLFRRTKDVAYFRSLAELTPNAFAVGVSIGPFLDGTAEAECAALLRQLQFVGVRDEPSLDRAKRLAPDVRTELTFDLALGLAEDVSPNSARTDSKTLGISLCPYESFYPGANAANEQRRVAVVADAVLQAAKAGDCERVVLLEFNSHRHFGDKRILDALEQAVSARISTTRVSYHTDPVALLNEVAQLRALLAMRLHAAVFGYTAAIPTIVFGYEEKCFEWARMIGQPRALVLDSLVSSATDIAAAIRSGMSANAPSPALPLKEAIRRSRRNWTWQQDQR